MLVRQQENMERIVLDALDRTTQLSDELRASVAELRSIIESLYPQEHP